MINVSVIKDGKPLMRQRHRHGQRPDQPERAAAISSQVTEQGAIYYIAQYPVEQQETRTFEIKVQTGDKIHTINFNQELFPGE
ncbi:DUF4426 domain-containing protein [Pseudomonas monsensis]|uniref:DUF4426 domain-containing protein n=1 Tax=Pseudomonas monsensis TaxID=2745509 RepID=UPI002AB8A8FC|nr:DUF4426 domain-containing protein [Pseudomonas monsensis]MDZ3828881.1 DUF4426 domain-containing protein [Pseudomonas monsensis]